MKRRKRSEKGEREVKRRKRWRSEEEYQAIYRKEAQDLLHEILSSQDVDDCGTENVERTKLVNTAFRSSLPVAMSKLMEAKLVLDQFGLHDAIHLKSSQAVKRPATSNKLWETYCCP